MGPRIAVVDYGAGNLQSVVNALERIGVDALLTAIFPPPRPADDQAERPAGEPAGERTA